MWEGRRAKIACTDADGSGVAVAVAPLYLRMLRDVMRRPRPPSALFLLLLRLDLVGPLRHY